MQPSALETMMDYQQVHHTLFGDHLCYNTAMNKRRNIVL